MELKRLSYEKRQKRHHFVIQIRSKTKANRDSPETFSLTRLSVSCVMMDQSQGDYFVSGSTRPGTQPGHVQLKGKACIRAKWLVRPEPIPVS